MARRMTTARYLREVLGFDLSAATRAGARVRCSRCQACTVNGMPIHERTCPNDTQECRGCNARIPASRFNNYCEECR